MKINESQSEPKTDRVEEESASAIDLGETEMAGPSEESLGGDDEGVDEGIETYPKSEAEAVTELEVDFTEPQKPPKAPKKTICAVSGKEVPKKKAIPLYALRPSLAERIRVDFPDIAANAPISLDAVGFYRSKVVEELMLHDRGELSELDRQVAESMSDH